MNSDLTMLDDRDVTLTRNCVRCRHLRQMRGAGTCAAFPDGIPDAIGSGRVSHATPYPGDNGILYSPLSIAELDAAIEEADRQLELL